MSFLSINYLPSLFPTNQCSSLAVTSLDPLDTSSSGGGGTSLTISDCEEILTDAHLGDSISVNGTSRPEMSRIFPFPVFLS